MTRNEYIHKYGYMSWLGRESLNNEVDGLLGGFGVNITAKQLNQLSEIIENHIKKGSK